MERSLKPKTPNLSLIVPPGVSATRTTSSKQRSQQISPRPPLTPNQSQSSIHTHVDGISPPKQKRLFPVACRLVPTDQWFTSRIDRTWKVLDLKLWLLSKALPTQILPLPASYRPSSPVTFAAAPPPPPRPSTSASYHPPQTPPGQRTASAPASPAPPALTPPSSPPAPTSPGPGSPTMSFPSPTSTRRFSVYMDDDEMPLYANPYGAVLEDHDIDDDDITRVAPRSIPYSYNTGAPAISGLDALKSNPNKASAGRGYSGGVAGVDMELVRKAEGIAKRWLLYTFSTGMLLSDDLPLSEYSISPFELLELHRAGAYVRLPRTTLPAIDPFPPEHSLHPPMALPPPASTVRAYYSITTRVPFAHAHQTHTEAREGDVSESDDDDYDDMTAGSPYAQPYFDGWVWVLSGGSGGATATGDTGSNDSGDVDGASVRRMRKRGRAKSEAAKANKGKDRARPEKEWLELQERPRNGAAEVTSEKEPQEKDRWKKRWLMVREGHLSVWMDRTDENPVVCFDVPACVGLYGADKIPSILASTPAGVAPYAISTLPDPTASLVSTTGSIPAPSLSSRAKHVVCARFRAPQAAQVEKPGSKGTRKSGQISGTWLVLRLADSTSHEHLLRIFHRLAYSSPVSSTGRPSTSSSTVAPARALPTRTLRTDFLPNPIPHPLSLSFSAPSPIAHSDESPVSPLDRLTSSDDGDYDADWADDASIWGRSRRKGPRKTAPPCMGLGRGMGVRFPEWRENVIKRAIKAGQGQPVEDGWDGHDDSLDEETPRGDQGDVYGFGKVETNSFATYLGRSDYDSDDPDSDAFSEAEWDGWAYDLDRPKVVDGVEVGFGNGRKPVRNGLATPQGSPVSEESETFSTVGCVDSFSIHAARPRAQSFSAESPIQSVVSVSPGSLSPSSATTPTTPGGRLRASTVSTHPRNITFTPVGHLGSPVPHFGNASSRADETTSVHRIETGAAGGGVRGLMRGLSMRAGRESFMRGLENALDFVEGK